jgi:hypothetical protein
MTRRSLVTLCFLILASLSIAYGKTYTFTLSNTAKVGNTDLKPGDYEVKVAGTRAIITSNSTKPVTVSIQVESNPKKFSQTAVEASNKDGVDVIKSITLGGTNTRITLVQ